MKTVTSVPLFSLPLILLIIMGQFRVKCFCPSTYIFPTTSCEFDYSFSDSSCTNFQFTKCSWVACISHSSAHSSSCSAYQTYTSSNWSACTSACCDPTKNYPYEADSIHQCQTDLTPSVAAPLEAIIASFVGCVLLTVIIVLFCCCKERIYSSCSCLKNMCEKITDCLLYMLTCRCFGRAQDEDSPIQKGTSTTNLELPVFDSTWSLQEISNQKLNDICSICLDGRPTVELECHHVYHRQCILLCLAKKLECAMCRSKQVKTAKIYCENCMNNFYEVYIKDHFRHLAASPQVCKNCKQFDEKKLEGTTQK